MVFLWFSIAFKVAMASPGPRQGRRTAQAKGVQPQVSRRSTEAPALWEKVFPWMAVPMAIQSYPLVMSK